MTKYLFLFGLFYFSLGIFSSTGCQVSNIPVNAEQDVAQNTAQDVAQNTEQEAEQDVATEEARSLKVFYGGVIYEGKNAAIICKDERAAGELAALKKHGDYQTRVADCSYKRFSKIMLFQKLGLEVEGLYVYVKTAIYGESGYWEKGVTELPSKDVLPIKPCSEAPLYLRDDCNRNLSEYYSNFETFPR